MNLRILGSLPLLLGVVAFAKAAESPLAFPGEALFNDHPPFLAGVLVNSKDGHYVEGELLQVEFQAEADAHLYLLYHQADGTTKLLFPNPAARDPQVPSRTRRQIPGEGSGNYRFRIGPPFGREVFQVVASLGRLPELDELVAPDNKAASVVSADRLRRLADRLHAAESSWAEHRIRIETQARSTPGNETNSSRSTVAGKRIGLFVGIGEYAHPELAPPHPELANSAKRLHELLLTQGGLDRDLAKLLLNQQATRARLEESIVRWLPSVSAPGDTVFIYFAGHAGQFESSDTLEPDHQDEALFSYDLAAGDKTDSSDVRRRKAREASITDDTLARWLQELTGRQVVLILDTCGDGKLTSGKMAGEGILGDEAQRAKGISQLNMIVLSYCTADSPGERKGAGEPTTRLIGCLMKGLDGKGQPRPVTVQQAFDACRQHWRTLMAEHPGGPLPEPTMTDTFRQPIDLLP